MDCAMSYLSRLRVDALIVSGDLVESPTEASYRLVRSWLARSGSPVFMIPGNADDRTAMRAVFSTHDYWPAAGPMNFAVVLDDAVHLIGFDVTVAGEAHGHATRDGLRWLAAECDREPRLPIVLMMHQHPFRIGIAPLDEAMCRNAEGLADVVERFRDRFGIVLCGHGHRAVFTTVRTVPAAMCPSLAPGNPLLLDGRGEPGGVDPPGLLIHHVHADGINSHVISLV
jgi:3',5'-cyclic AMP phosphodiesterase CpdA